MVWMICAHYTAVGLLLAAVACLGVWFERVVSDHDLDRVDLARLWALRLAGLWLLGCLLLPVPVRGQTTIETMREQAVLNTAHIASLDARVAHIEDLHLEGQLATLQEAAQDVRTMRQYLVGMAMTMLVMMLTQVAGLIRRK